MEQMKAVAQAIMVLACDVVGDQSYMMEDSCDDYNEVRLTLIGESTFTIEEQKKHMLKFARDYKITRSDILKYLAEKNDVPW